MIARLTLTLRSPFLIGGEEELAAGLDAVLLRNAEGKAIIPGTAIKGLMRDALMSLSELGHPIATEARINRWFGQSSAQNNEPLPGTLIFGDLVAVTDELSNGAHYARVAIDEETGSARSGALQFIELPWPVGGEVSFSGELHNAIASVDQDEVELLDLALDVIPALGSMRGIGFGQITKRTLESEDGATQAREATGAKAAIAVGNGSDLLLFVRFSGPFVVASERPDHNSFVGSDLVPGGALKGAIAERLGSGTTAGPVLSAVTVHHGYPVPDENLLDAQEFAPRPISRSIAIVQGAESAAPAMIDLMDHDTAPLVHSSHGLGFVPLALAPDWKTSEVVAVENALAAMNGFSNALAARPRRERRTRVAMDSKTGTALDRQLFSHDAVSPIAQKMSSKSDKLLWAFRVTGTQTELDRFNHLVAGLRLSLGKLGTPAFITETVYVPGRMASIDGSKVLITLATPAVLNTFAQLKAARGCIVDAYQAHFRSIDPGLILDRFFGNQKLITGYQAIRFRSNDDRFEPWIRTEAGSTFLLSFDSARSGSSTLNDLVAGWLRHGLPPAGAGVVDAWRKHPYPRENGYGQIIIGKMNLPSLPFGFSIVKRGAA